MILGAINNIFHNIMLQIVKTEVLRVFLLPGSQLSQMNSGVAAEKSDVMSPVTWTSTTNKPEFLVGKEVGEVKNIFVTFYLLIAYINLHIFIKNL